MIIFLSELQKEHLNLLHQHSAQVVVDFCKLTIDYLGNGINVKKCTNAAEKLDVSLTVIQNLIYALSYLIVEGCKHNISDKNFKSSLALAGFSDEQQRVLLKFYNTKKAEISRALNLLQQKDPSYQDITWRFEVQIASNSSNEEIIPMVAMDFVLTTPKNLGHSEENFTHPKNNQMNPLLPVNKATTIQDARTASECQNVINHILLQCDLPNLIHLTQRLDKALKETKSHHIRKVQRAI